MRVAIALIVLLALGGNELRADPAAEPITKPGEQSSFDGKVRVRVTDDGQTTTFEVLFDRGMAMVSSKTAAKSTVARGWFVVAESADRVWVWQGGNALTLLEYTANPPGDPAGGRLSSIALAPGTKNTAALIARAPKSVRERLPAAFQSPAPGK